MQVTPKYVILDLAVSLRTQSFMLLFLCALFPLTPNGDPAVGVIQGDVFMSWGINSTDNSSFRGVLNPAGSTVIIFPQKSSIGNATPAFSNRVTDIGSVSQGMVSFRLLNLTVADAGRYYYKILPGTDAGGQVLVIAGNPANISVTEVADPVENGMYTVQCSAQSTSVPAGNGLTMNYQWMRENGQIITASDRYSFSSDQSSLIINPLKRQDDDTLVCKAWEHVGTVSQSSPFSLKVFYGPDTGSIHLSPNQTSYDLTESSTLSVNCSTDCFPDCQYRWTGPSGSSASSTGLLSIISVVRSQTGQYTCTASNPKIPNKTATVALSVTVFYGPDDRNVSLSPSNTSYQLTELSSLAVQCFATCVPHCEYQWSGPLVSQNDNTDLLSISQIQRNQNGTFTCRVTNPKIPGKSATASFVVIVYYGPDTNGTTLSPSNTSYQLTEFSPLIVQCSATCVPQCNYQWIGPGISQNDNKGLLSVSMISRNQAGTFVCTVTNSRIPGKSATASIYVTVYFPPVLTMKATNTSKGGRVVISCLASGVPDNYTFYKWTHMAPDESRTIIRELEVTSVSGNEASLTIEGATYQDTGFYVCKASNGIAHYSTGQLIMEDLVSVWITDQPIITSIARDFDAEKGKSGLMYTEFYSGLLQPIVTWYLVKNDSMELLGNSSNFGMYLSNVTVEVKYYQMTVRLKGYNASLEVFDVAEEQFTSYKVEINNSCAEPVFWTLELKSRGPPETPANLSVVPDSVTTHSLQLTWQAGFHGGAPQTFVIEYREIGKTDWLKKSETRGLVQYITLNATITDLKDGTKYEFRIYSENVFNRSQVSSTINETTKTVLVLKDELGNPNGSPVIIGAATGSALVLVIAVAIVGFLFYKRRQTIRSPKEDVDVLQDRKSLSDRDKSGLVDNPVYEASGPLPDPSTSGNSTGVEYATVVKPKKNGRHVDDVNSLYAQVDKTNKGKNKGQVKEKHGKAHRGDIYENSTLAGRDNLKGNVFENSGDLMADQNVYENQVEETPKGSLAKKDDLMYADLMLDAPTSKNGKYVIRGLENRTEYAEIAYGKRGEPIPDNNEEK